MLAERAVGRHASTLPGAGAAGGLGFALQSIGGEMRSGAQVVADLVGLDAALTGADWVITGEGRSDRQTLLGKTPWVVAQRAAAKDAPVTLLSGSIDPAALPELGEHFAGCFACLRVRRHWPIASTTHRHCSPIAPSNRAIVRRRAPLIHARDPNEFGPAAPRHAFAGANSFARERPLNASRNRWSRSVRRPRPHVPRST